MVAGLTFWLVAMLAVGRLTAPCYEVLVRYMSYGTGPCDAPVMAVCTCSRIPYV